VNRASAETAAPPSGAPPPGAPHAGAHGTGLAALAFGTLGVVYGDIGTSPLYAIRACFNVAGGGVAPTPENVLGVLSLIFWSLVLVVSTWYVIFIMRASNRGEGGILALMSLALPAVAASRRRRAAVLAAGLFGAALLYGDGMITPAITVLGAMEGLPQVTPALEPLILPLSVVFLILLFLLQRRGTAGIATLFSPITLVWFLSIAALGIRELVREPEVLAAVNPLYALEFFRDNGLRGFLTLGFVFLVVTGAEALYADMGHFGPRPIRLAWFTLVLPALLLNYFGQGAYVFHRPEAVENPFYAIVPRPLLYPMIGVATAAAAVASQALISGAFSLTRQALQLGYVPRLTIRHTSGELEGRIYVPSVNWALMVSCCGLVLAFGSSDDLATAYGIAVTATMAVTTVLFFIVARNQLGWSLPRALMLCGFFLVIDLSFFAANAVKIPQGGWFPLLVAAVVYVLMITWRRGRDVLQAIGQKASLPLDLLLEDLGNRPVPRVPGTAVFMNAEPEGAPLVLLHHLKHNKALHERVVLLSVLTEEVPTVPRSERVHLTERGQGFLLVTGRYGFMQTPSAPEILRTVDEILRASGREPPPSQREKTYYLGRQTLIPTGTSPMARWRKKLFLVMARNALPATAYFRLPPNRVVELGAQVRF
jgi:KUP system potassium uptake protein